MVAPLDMSSSNLAIDTQSLAQLRTQAKTSPDKALKSAAQQFESVFLNMMLKSMREATSQGGMFDNEQSKLFTGMLDQQLSQSMSKKGIGLADAMVKQLSHQMGVQSPTQGAHLNVAVPSLKAGGASAQNTMPSAYNATTQQDFVNQMLPHAMQASQSSGVPTQLILGQAALESGWGKREIRNADGSNSHNLFGIKAGSGWTGKVSNVVTTEYQNGVAHKQVEQFRSYSSYAEAFQDYAHMLSSSPRYASVLQQGGNAAGMAQALQKSGYATDPKYAEKLVQVMGKMNLAA